MLYLLALLFFLDDWLRLLFYQGDLDLSEIGDVTELADEAFFRRFQHLKIVDQCVTHDTEPLGVQDLVNGHALGVIILEHTPQEVLKGLRDAHFVGVAV